MHTKHFLSTLLATLFALPTMAGGDDFGLWYSLEASKRLAPAWSLGAEAELRTRNNTKTLDRWSLGLSVTFKATPWLKASAGYTLLDNHNPEKISWQDDEPNVPNKWTPSYWGLRHRCNVSLTGSVDLGRFGLSLRERWQYTYRPLAKEKKYDVDNDEWDDVKSKGKHALRSRLQVDYNIPKCKVDPFANVEMFNYQGGERKMRYQAGVEWKLSKQHVFQLAYRYQTVNNDDDDDGDTNSHLIGLGYKFKF